MTCNRFERDGLLAFVGGRPDPHVDACPDCRTRRDSYSRLVSAIARGPDRPLPRGWKERTLARLRAEQTARRRRRVWRAGLVTAAAVAAILVLIPDGDPRPEPRVSVEIEKGDGVWRGEIHPGSILRASADPDPYEAFELRVYYESRDLLLRCPGAPAPACRIDDDGRVQARLPLASVGKYQVLWLVSSDPLPAPTGDLDVDTSAARKAGAVPAPLRTAEVR